MSQMARIHPILFEMAEIIRCRFEMGVCLSLYRNPAAPGEPVEATIRTQIFYENKVVCLVKNYKDVVEDVNGQKGCCIKNEKCKITFPAVPGIYYAFIDSHGSCNDEMGGCDRAIPFSEEPKSKDTVLVTYHLIKKM